MFDSVVPAELREKCSSMVANYEDIERLFDLDGFHDEYAAGDDTAELRVKYGIPDYETFFVLVHSKLICFLLEGTEEGDKNFRRMLVDMAVNHPEAGHIHYIKGVLESVGINTGFMSNFKEAAERRGQFFGRGGDPELN